MISNGKIKAMEEVLRDFAKTNPDDPSYFAKKAEVHFICTPESILELIRRLYKSESK